ncbi:MAG TPA: sigma-E factor negative regulatory protein [Arenicellales bacterium]|nr:sigma-E factor negative regulatory protein [Arenicellales bacterium]
MYEKLSALIDNELDELERARVLRELGRSDELADCWSRYHIIGLAMRREKIMPPGDLAKRVSVALDEEPAEVGEPPAPRKSLFRSTGRLAIAASAAAVLLAGGIFVKIYDGERPAATVASTPSQQIASAPGALHWEGADPRSADALNALLIEHGEFTSASGMNGLTAYTKFVAYDAQ